ncbi:Sec-independent protein translocase protein TatB [Thalassovita sp.]|jgi:sec-independent protein translocase protein TatB|uniref:Sec-independent protein translocase protein TatB n=1 Tax=Thalassovita sp. TaxID=1979401 RepID=UPI003B5B4CEC
MFDLGWTELLVIGIVALIVVGPKDLPGLFRTVGRFVGKAKGMAREFSRAMEDAADDAGVKDISTSIKAAANPAQFGLDKVKEATKDVTDGLTQWDPTKDESLDEDRAAVAKKIHEATAKREADRQAAEAEAAQAAQAAEAQPASDEVPKDKA